MAKLLAAAVSDAGRVRDHNEDAVRLAEPDSDAARERGFLMVVADGMGGHQHGEVASSLAVEALFSTFYGESAANGDVAVLARLTRGFTVANERIIAESGGGTAASAMGTTMVAAAIAGAHLTVANVGDSRAYLVRAEAATQITHDHSLVAEQVAAGTMSPEQAKESRHRNIITRALGHQPKVDVDRFEITLLPDDRVILCTDGVHGHVEPEEFASITLSEPPEGACRRLVDLALERGSTDNVTVALVAYEPAQVAVAGGEAREPAPAGASRVGPALLILLLIAVLAVLLVVAYNQRFFGFFG